MALAEEARGRTSPNPIVGCVILRDGQVVGEGCHRGPGRPHAEQSALAAAGERARGATLVCTLEPCCHHGRTPPCTDAILAAGVTRVVCGVLDPDPRVAGQGAAVLRAAGLEVEVGVLGDEVAHQLRAYLHHRRTGRPWVTAKWAMTLDGRVAAGGGDSRWISGPAARERVQRLRDGADAILVGSGTILADDPSLTRREASGEPKREQPLRVIADTRGAVPSTARVFTDGLAPTLWVTSLARHAVPPPGIEHLAVPEAEGHLSLPTLLAALGERGIVEVLSEAGGGLTGGLFRAGLIHEVVAFVAPKLVGGDGGSPWAGPGVALLAEAVRLARVSVERVGDDAMIRGIVAPSTASEEPPG